MKIVDKLVIGNRVKVIVDLLNSQYAEALAHTMQTTAHNIQCRYVCSFVPMHELTVDILCTTV